MPAYRLPASQDVTRRIAQYDVVGTDSQPGFIGHVALAAGAVDRLASESSVDVIHMMPPLTQGPLGPPIHAAATAELTDDQQRRIRFFIEEMSAELRAQGRREQYTILPHVQVAPGRDGRTDRYRRFSCAGFVLAAYQEARIRLFREPDDGYPPVALQTLCLAYPEWAGLLASPRFRQEFGLSGEGPWPVVLPGYILHAMNRPAADIRARPYQPRSGDEYFRG